MGDLMNNTETFKKLGFDSQNQWIFYDDRFLKFFNFVAENITEGNLLTEYEVLQRDSLTQQNQYLDGCELQKRILDLENQYSGLLEYTYVDVITLTQRIANLQQMEETYGRLISEMGTTKIRINSRLIQLEDNLNSLSALEKECLIICQNKAKQLEEMQTENCKLSIECKKSFAKVQSPPLFIHQMSFDQYFLNCDSFMQYFQLFMKENFKIQEYIDFDSQTTNIEEIADKLQLLEKSMYHYTLEYIKEKAKVCATNSIINLLDQSKIHIISFADMTRETQELENVNEHYSKNAYETLMNDLIIHVQQRAEQRMEMILYENTKQKLHRAIKRYESVKCLTMIISDALSNAELIWIAMQMDLEKFRNRFDNSQIMSTETQSCLRRIKIMSNLNISIQSQKAICKQNFLEKLSELLEQPPLRIDAKSYVYEYEKFCRLTIYALKGMVNKKLYVSINEQINELKNVEQILKPLVYDSPVQVPMFENVVFLRPIFNIKLQQQRIYKVLRSLRTQFQENITERTVKDKFWRYTQLLWIWFLTDPRRVLMAIEEIKSAASKQPVKTVQKTLGGLKRK